MAGLDDPEITVIVPARDGARSLPPLLDGLNSQTLDRERYEVIVVDNASRDETAQVALGAGARVVREPIANRSRARNAGAREARGRLFAFTDADCTVANDWLEGFLSCDTDKPLLAGPVFVVTEQPPNLIERFETRWRFGQEEAVRDGWAATANLLVTREAFEAIGGLDVTYHHIGEDADFCLRARRAGFELGYCPDAVVRHVAEREWGPLLQRAFRHGYSVNQIHHRLGVGYRAWRHPGPAVRGDWALTSLGQDPGTLEPDERRELLRVARLTYAARVVGSVWAEARRAR